MRQQRVVIVGAGIIGLATAYALLARGAKHVTVLEQATVDHPRGTSHGISRLLRFEYGVNAFYTEMVGLSLSRWKQLEQISGSTIYTRSGVLVLGHERDSFTQPSYGALRVAGLPIERLGPRQCQQRFPQFAGQDYDFITHNAEAGILHASTCLRVLKRLVLEMGGTIRECCRVSRIGSDSQMRPLRVVTSAGDELAAERVVIAAGPWVQRLLPELALPVRLTRQYLLYFAGLPSAQFAVNTFPAFMTSDLYGFPLHTTSSASGWLKAASHIFGAPADPDKALPMEEHVIATVTRQLRELLPALAQARLAHVDACMYDVTADEHFILDRHPHDERIVLATGLSGHGFKFGLLLGELLSSLVCDTEPVVALERFQLARFAHMQEAVSVA